MYLTEEIILIAELKDIKTKELAFRKLITQYKERLYWHIRKIVISHDDTDDVLQNTFIKIFKKHVEAITGGPEAVKFGGKRIGKKLTSDEYYLRAAAVVLWKFYKKHKQHDAIDQLVLDARSVIKVGSKKKLAKLVDNFEQNHDITLKNSKSPLSPHIGGIEDLVKNHGYLKLNDFV